MTEFFAAYAWALPVTIFFGRICDVSLGTLRIVFVAKGEKTMAPIIGFVEVFIWIVIIAQVLSQANDIYSYVAYAGGYATGTYIGLLVEERIGLGFVVYRVFTVRNGFDLVAMFKQNGFGATVTHGEGSVAEIDIVEAAVGRKDSRSVEAIIDAFDPKAFYLVEDVRAKEKGVFTKRQSLLLRK